jgi:hypothetical protein
MRGAAGALAVVLARPLEGAHPLNLCILKEGRKIVMQGYLLQLGKEPVIYQSPGMHLVAPAIQTTTEVMALAISKEHADAQVWDAAERQPVFVFRGWLKHQEVRVQDVWHARREGSGSDARISVLIRVPKCEVERTLKASGANCVFSRCLGKFTTQVVWLESKTTREEAWGISQRHKGALGLVLGSSGLGIRCQEEDVMHLTKVLLGDEAARKRECALWEITGLPLGADVGETMAALREQWQWDAQLVKALPRTGVRVLLVRAVQQPPDTMVTLGRWLLAVTPVGAKQPSQRERVTFSWHRAGSAGHSSANLWTEKPARGGKEGPGTLGEAPSGEQLQPPTSLPTPREALEPAPTYRDTPEGEAEEDEDMLAANTPQAVKRLRA